MRKHTRTSYLFIALFTCCTKLAASDIINLTIPSELGFVTEVHPPSTADKPTLIHLQEAHTNYNGQRHLAAIIQELHAKYGVRLVMVEAGEGDVSLSNLRQYGSLEARQQVAEKYLKAGLISGEEYLVLTTDADLALWGVEELSLYEQNLQAFLEAKAVQPILSAALDAVQKAVQLLAPKLYDPALIELNAKSAAFEQSEIGMGDYVSVLMKASQKAGIAVDPETLVAKFSRLDALDKNIDRNQLSKEQAALLKALGGLLAAQDIKVLIDQAYSIKSGKGKRDDFYSALEAASVKASHPLSDYPNLSQYFRYVKEISQISAVKLSDELKELLPRVQSGLAQTESSRQLSQIDNQLRLLRSAVELKLSPEEYAQFMQEDASALIAAWPQSLNALLNASNLPQQDFPGLGAWPAGTPILQRFYELAARRDVVLFENALAKLTSSGERVAVLITGGFHGPEITKRLTGQGIGVVVVVPKVGLGDDDHLYEAVLQYKHGTGSYDAVMEAGGF